MKTIITLIVLCSFVVMGQDKYPSLTVGAGVTGFEHEFNTTFNGYNRLRLHQKLQANKFSLVKCFTAEDYIKLLEQVYNLNAVEPLRFL